MTDRDISGVLCVNKPSGMTSHDVVNSIRKLYRTKKVGHTGTLDPIADGVLTILLGKATKLSDYLSVDTKVYRAGIKFGTVTDSQDVTGEIISSCNSNVEETSLKKVCNEFIGKILQTPPMYSAKKINGEKLYNLARKGIVVERKPEEIEIYSIDVDEFDQKQQTAIITVNCSKGTYIRTLCDDVGKRLGCGACMTSLTRLSNGNFIIDNSYSPDAISSMTEEQRYSIIQSTESVLSCYDKIVLPDFYAKLCNNGCEIYQRKIGDRHQVGCFLRMYNGNGVLLALGKVLEFNDGTAVKPVVKLI